MTRYSRVWTLVTWIPLLALLFALIMYGALTKSARIEDMMQKFSAYMEKSEAQRLATVLNEESLLLIGYTTADAGQKSLLLDFACGEELSKGNQKKAVILHDIAGYLLESNPSQELQMTFVKEAELQEMDPDIYVRMDFYDSGDPSDYGIQGEYNPLFFTPEITNAELAQILVRSLAMATSNRGRDFVMAEEGSKLWEMKITSARIGIGNLSNTEEMELLSQKAYQQRVAQGLLNAINEMMDKKETR